MERKESTVASDILSKRRGSETDLRSNSTVTDVVSCFVVPLGEVRGASHAASRGQSTFPSERRNSLVARPCPCRQPRREGLRERERVRGIDRGREGEDGVRFIG